MEEAHSGPEAVVASMLPGLKVLRKIYAECGGPYIAENVVAYSRLQSRVWSVFCLGEDSGVLSRRQFWLYEAGMCTQ